MIWCAKTPYVLIATTKFSFICLLSGFVVVTKAIVEMYHKNVEFTGSASAGNRLINQTYLHGNAVENPQSKPPMQKT
jgi:hypothetical protein